MSGERGALVVTGGSRGIGAAICRLAAARGYPVAVNYAGSPGAAAAVVAEISAAGGRAVAVGADLSDEAGVLRLFAEAEAALGPIGGLVNNAAITGGFARVEELTAEMIGQVLALNVAGPLLCCREAVRRMSTRRGGRGGAIVNISSVAARTGSGGEWVHYAASKAAVNTLTLGLAREVAAEGIRVNAVAPGLVLTDIHAAAGDPGRPDRLAPHIPMARAGRPEEVAEAVVWLLSPAASYVTGTILDVGGGR